MTAKTPARPRKTTTRSRKTAAQPDAVAVVDTDGGADAAVAPEQDVVASKPAAKTRARAATPRKRTTRAKTVETVAEEAPTPVAEAAADTAPAEKPARKPATRRKKAGPKAAPVEAVEIIAAPEAVEDTTPANSASEEAEPVADTAEPAAKTTTFADLELSEPILRAINDMGYVHPTPIQEQAIPAVLMARDVLGVAQTGTGKTASFTLPMLEILSDSRARARMPRSLILEPTRELALQVAENFVNYGKYLKLNHALLIGGESMAEQKEVLNRGVDVLIATPGRLLDLFGRGGLLLTHTKILVIDEADRMLDMGFIPDIEKIVALLPPTRQTLFFSATMAPTIRKLADAFLHSPKEITVARQSSVASTITTGLLVVDEYKKRDTLRLLLKDPTLQNAIVFCNRKRDVDILSRSLVQHGFSAGALHGDLPQSVRFATLERFKNGELKVLVCSDVAARGIDIGGLSHVFNFDLPFHAEDYVHRIGRTGRAGREGHAYSLACPYDKALAEAIEQLTGKPIPRMTLDNVENLDWAEGKRPPTERNRKDKDGEKPTGRKDTSRHDTPRGPRAEQRPAQPPQSAHPGRGPRHQRDDIPPVPAGDSLGFGDLMPAFMMLPRRASDRPATPGMAPQTDAHSDTAPVDAS